MILIGIGAICVYSDPLSADEILAFVRNHLPLEPITCTGTLCVTAPNGYVINKAPVEMKLEWGGQPPKAVYRIGKTDSRDFQTLEVQWDEYNRPVYHFSENGKIQKDFDPNSKILDTGIRWADLSFSMLWWKGGTVYGSEKKKGRDCYVVDLPVPGTTDTMRLWVEKKMGLLMETQRFNAEKEQIQRVKVISLKKVDGMWVVKDLEITHTGSRNKTTLRIDDLKALQP